MNTDFTPGPWRAVAIPRSKTTWGLSILCGDVPDVAAGLIADVAGIYKQGRIRSDVLPETEANARLIAASPALYAAVKQLLEAYAPNAEQSAQNEGEQCLHSSVQRARAALALVESEAA